ncbi:MAG: ShlB/FhaC/HecB family hemolysin secretion/activation protein [Polaromonas sp.]|nr:ShlB/FhaC/HecB family hemolysin secretion/activation protein [Polaromonas sp.]
MKSARNVSRLVTASTAGMLATLLHAQPVVTPDLLNQAEQQQRRQQEREDAQRQQLQPAPDVRLPAMAPAALPLLRDGETPCFVIQHIVTGVSGAGNGPSSIRRKTGDDARLVLESDAALAGVNGDDPPLGRCLGAEAIQAVAGRAQAALIARGFVTTRVLVEPQDLSGGTLKLTVVPGRIRNIRFATNEDHRGQVWNALPASSGDLLNLRDIEQALENFKRVPTAEADIQITPTGPDGAPANAGQAGESDLVITYRQGFPARIALSADDSGTRATGRYQGSVTLSYDNPLTLNDLFYVSRSGDLHGNRGGQGVRGTGGSTVHYAVPFGYWLLGATASSNRYHQTVAGLNQDYVYSGENNNLEIKLSRLVYRDVARKTTLSVRAFRRDARNFIDDTEVQNQRRVVGGYELSASHREFLGSSTLDLNLAYKRGTGAFGAMPAPEELFGEGTSRMKLFTLDAGFSVPFQLASQTFRYSGQLRAQMDRSRLTPQDRFAIGGRYTVRGFDGESSLSAERGWLVRNEVSAALGNSGQQAYAGLDHGEVGGPSARWLVGRRLTGLVVGVRGQLQHLQYELFIGAPLRKPEYFRTASSSAGFSLNYSF